MCILNPIRHLEWSCCIFWNQVFFHRLDTEKSPLLQGIVYAAQIPDEENKEQLTKSTEGDDGNKMFYHSIDNETEKNSENAETRSIMSYHSVKSREFRRKSKLRTFCLIIALMIHSLFEGLTVGLQDTEIGLVELVAILAFHKGLIGFSLGINILNSKQKICLHARQGVS